MNTESGSEPNLSESIPNPAPKSEAPPSYVKLAMRNMVKKRGLSLFHFALTSAGLIAVLVGLSFAFR
jgi:Protein of unknown function (DUF3285)